MHELKSLKIESGKTLDLGDLTLERSGMRIELALKHPATIADKKNIQIRVMRPGSPEELDRFIMSKAVQSFYLSEQVCDIIVQMPGYRKKLITNVTGGRVDIRLTRGIVVDVRLANPETVPTGMEFEFVLWPVKQIDTLTRIDRESGGFFHLPSPGKYRVGGQLIRRQEGSSSTRSVHVSPAEIVVDDVESLQAYRVTVDAKEIEGAAQRLSK